jgi:hypothetical protein
MSSAGVSGQVFIMRSSMPQWTVDNLEFIFGFNGRGREDKKPSANTTVSYSELLNSDAEHFAEDFLCFLITRMRNSFT